MGREYRGEERREETVDLPVAMEPVRPMINIVWFTMCCSGGRGVVVGGQSWRQIEDELGDGFSACAGDQVGFRCRLIRIV